MPRLVPRRFRLSAALVFAALLAVAAATARSGPPPANRGDEGGADAKPPRPSPCCFVNPSYAGVCSVQPEKDETCASILAYLNNPGSTGKGYCSNTSLRGDWTQVVCESEPEPK
jgi:hypothetical protein